MVPVTRASGWQLHVAFDEEDTGVADFAAAFLDEAEAFLEQGLVPFAVGETGAEIKQKTYYDTFNSSEVLKPVSVNLLNSRKFSEEVQGTFPILFLKSSKQKCFMIDGYLWNN